MQSVTAAIERGWKLVLPIQRMTADANIVLMRRVRQDGKLELGLAVDRAA